MKPRSPLAIFATALLLSLGLFAGACSGGGGSDAPLTLEEYFQRLEAMINEAEERFFEGIGEFGQQLNSPDLEQRIDAYQGVANRNVALFEDFFDGMNDLEPPGEAADAHNEYARATRDMLESLRDLSTRFNDVESDAELEELIEEQP